MTVPLSYEEFSEQPVGAVVGSLDDAGAVWSRAMRYPGCWKVFGYIGMRSDQVAWSTLEGDDGSAVVQLYVDEELAQRPPTEAEAIAEGEHQRAERIRARTAGLEPGWYVTTGFFWHDDPMVVDGPIPEFEPARMRRAEIEQRSAGPVLYLDVVEEVPRACTLTVR